MAIDDHTILILGGCGGPNLVGVMTVIQCLYLTDNRPIAVRVSPELETNGSQLATD